MPVPITAAFTAIGADDLAASVSFYRRLLGREPDDRVREVYAEFHLPGLRLGLFTPRESNRSEFTGSAGGLSLVLEVPDVDQARAEIEALRPIRPPGPIDSTRHGREFYAYDPDGNRLILVERLPDA